MTQPDLHGYPWLCRYLHGQQNAVWISIGVQRSRNEGRVGCPHCASRLDSSVTLASGRGTSLGGWQFDSQPSISYPPPSQGKATLQAPDGTELPIYMMFFSMRRMTMVSWIGRLWGRQAIRDPKRSVGHDEAKAASEE